MRRCVSTQHPGSSRSRFSPSSRSGAPRSRRRSPAEARGEGRPSAAPAREKTLPDPVTPPIPDALSRALARGQISEGRYVLERAVSLFDPARVRSRFGNVSRPDPRSATLVLRDLALRLDRLSAGELKDARRILARPTDGDVPLGHAYTVGEETPFCAAHTCVHYVGSTDDAPPPVDVTGGPEPDYVADVSAVVEEVWTAEVGTLGYRSAEVGRNLRRRRRERAARCVPRGHRCGRPLRVLRERRSEPRSFATRTGTCRATACWTTTTSISQFGYPDPTLPLKVTAAHELFHAVQFAYDFGEDGWLMEGTATWMEERVYDAINDNRRYLVQQPAGSSSDPARPEHGVPLSTARGSSGSSSRSTSVARCPTRPSCARSGGEPTGARSVRTCTRRRRWRLRWELGPSGGRDGASAGRSRTSRSGTPVPGSTTTKVRRIQRLRSPERRHSPGPPPSRTATAKLDHLANRFVVVRRGSGLKATARLRITVDGPNHGTGPEASVVVIRKSGASTYKVVDLNSVGNGEVTVAFGTTVARVVVIMTNASTRYTNCYAGDHPVRLFRGCAGRPEPQLHVPRGRRLTRRSVGVGADGERERDRVVGSRPAFLVEPIHPPAGDVGHVGGAVEREVGPDLRHARSPHHAVADRGRDGDAREASSPSEVETGPTTGGGRGSTRSSPPTPCGSPGPSRRARTGASAASIFVEVRPVDLVSPARALHRGSTCRTGARPPPVASRGRSRSRRPSAGVRRRRPRAARSRRPDAGPRRRRSARRRASRPHGASDRR